MESEAPKKVNRPLVAKIGLGLCFLGFLVGLAGLFLPSGPKGSAPLFLMALGLGGMIYIPSAFLVFWAERPYKTKPAGKLLFWIRTAFVALILIALLRMM